MKDLEISEREATSKYLEIKNKCLQLEDTVHTLQGTLRQTETQLQSSKEVWYPLKSVGRNLKKITSNQFQKTEKLENDKTRMKEIVREELKNEISSLEKEVSVLRNDRDKELQQIYARWEKRR